EDGIRDGHVTGVQTCALPIWNVWAQCFEGILLIRRGDNLAGSQLLQSALERLPEPSFHYHMSSLLAELAAGLAGAGQIAEGLVEIGRASGRERVECSVVAGTL